MGPFPQGDRFPAAHDSPEYELSSIRRSLEDLDRPHGSASSLRLLWVLVSLAILLFFLSWLALGTHVGP